VPLDELEQVKQTLPQLMAGVAQLKVPLVADLGFGPNWEQAH
jgi:DNA polymerase-1